MEEGKLKRKKISAETTVEILFFLFLLQTAQLNIHEHFPRHRRCAIRLRIIFISMVHFR